MARGKNLSEAMKAEILRLSGEGKSGAEIGRTLGVEQGTVTYFLKRKRFEQIRTCEFCGKTIKDSEAIFCPYCGKKILTDRDRLEAHLREISSAVCEFPTSQREKILKAVTEVRTIVKRMEGTGK